MINKITSNPNKTQSCMIYHVSFFMHSKFFFKYGQQRSKFSKHHVNKQ